MMDTLDDFGQKERETRQRREEKSSNETYNLSLQYAYDCNAKQAEKGNYTIHELCAWSHFSCKWLPSSRCVLCNGIKCSSHNHLINCLFSLSSLVWQERLVFLYIDVGGKNIQCFSLCLSILRWQSLTSCVWHYIDRKKRGERHVKSRLQAKVMNDRNRNA